MTPGLSSTVIVWPPFALPTSESVEHSTTESTNNSAARRSAAARSRFPASRNPRADDLSRSAPRVECVSRSNSSQTRSRSASRPSGRISTSQSIAHPLRGGEDSGQFFGVLIQHDLAKLAQTANELVQRECQG